MILSEEKIKEFNEASKTLVEWMQKNCDPHATAIVAQTSAELVYGVAMTTFEYEPPTHEKKETNSANQYYRMCII